MNWRPLGTLSKTVMPSGLTAARSRNLAARALGPLLIPMKYVGMSRSPIVRWASSPVSWSGENSMAIAEKTARYRAEYRSSKIGKHYNAKLHIGITSPARAVLDGCEHLHPELVVMGTISRGGLPGVLLGNTAERLLPRLDVSLLTVKPDDFVCPVSLG